MPGGLGGSSSASGNNPLGGNGGTRDSSFSNNKDNGDNGNDEGGGMIQADSATNSLIITAPEPVYRNLRAVIDQLDARRAQVYIEALIVELSATTVANLGYSVQGLLLSNGGNNALYGSSSFGQNNGNIADLTALGATASSNISSLASSMPILPNGLNVGLSYTASATISVSVAYLRRCRRRQHPCRRRTSSRSTTRKRRSSSARTAGRDRFVRHVDRQHGDVTAFNTFDRRDVGVTLHVKPQITQGGVLKLQLYQKDSRLTPPPTNNPGGVTINTRSIQSTVLADDGEIVVLGGLMQDQNNNGNSKIALLGDIPFIGSLFRSKNKTRTKTNLMVFLRSVIMRAMNICVSSSMVRSRIIA